MPAPGAASQGGAACTPKLLQHPDDARAILAGQRFFLRAFQVSPLCERIRAVAVPKPGDFSNDALMHHCRRFVKTNYHPAGTCRMGPPGDPLAMLDTRMRMCKVDRLRVSDLSAMPDINAGDTSIPAMMLGSRCAAFVAGAT